MKKLLALAVVILGFTAVSFGQSTKTATASATIVGPISLAKDLDINFGNIAVGATGGTVTIDPASGRTFTGGVTLPIVAGTVNAAKFTVSGEGDRTFSITIPAAGYDLTLTRVSGTETMTVNSFVSTPTGTGTLVLGTQTINVGATITVASGQIAGVYTNVVTGFPVTVNYN